MEKMERDFCDADRPLKRICAVHDLSCFGRCALTVVLPTLSAMGYQAVPLPTALLSTHTGGFTDMHFRDLTRDIEKITEHFAQLDLGFDAIYSGFLGDARQIDVVSRLIDRFSREDTLVLVDPVMGDDGVLYSTYTPELVEGMRRLCHKADIITPNMTEAFFLTEREFVDTTELSRDETLDIVRSLCTDLRKFSSKKIVITGIPFGNSDFATYGFDAESETEYFYSSHRIELSYPGTGDLFASVLLGQLLGGSDFYSALSSTSSFVARVMDYSSHYKTPLRDGVAFEAFLGELAASANTGR